ncbi:MAG: hypothetical protein JWR09_4698 [Mucilaginibacter sp.]|nr:hypothetical protein [Mucilaginibacter sp.]
MKPEKLELDEQSLKDIMSEMTIVVDKGHQFMEAQKQEMEKKDRIIAEKNKQIEQQMAAFNESVKNIRVTAPPPDLSVVTNAMKSGLAEINQTIDKGPKPIHRSLKINLFPETNAREYYRMVYGKFFRWGLIFTVVIYLGSFVNKSIDAYQAHQYNEDGNNCIKAWNNIYNHSGPLVQKRMSKTLEDASK